MRSEIFCFSQYQHEKISNSNFLQEFHIFLKFRPIFVILWPILGEKIEKKLKFLDFRNIGMKRYLLSIFYQNFIFFSQLGRYCSFYSSFKAKIWEIFEKIEILMDKMKYISFYTIISRIQKFQNFPIFLHENCCKMCNIYTTVKKI